MGESLVLFFGYEFSYKSTAGGEQQGIHIARSERQFPEGFFTPSITSTSNGAFAESSFNPIS
jgi:hypothetical protein